MIKASELKIGNYLQDRENRLCKVESIDISFIDSIVGEAFKAPAIVGGLTSLPHKSIKLTDEWLVKLGFEKEPEKYNSVKYKIPYKFNWDKNPLVYFIIYDFEYHASGEDFKGWLIPLTDGEFFMSCKNVEVKYLHELQNLYFAITSNELSLAKI